MISKTRAEDIIAKDLSEFFNVTVDPVYEVKIISKNDYNYMLLMAELNDRIATAYVLPKLHKKSNPVPFRLVVSTFGTKIFGVSRWIDIHLQIICKQLTSYLKNSDHLINILESL